MKKLLCVLLAAIMLLSFAACAVNGDGDGTTTAATTTGEPEVKDPGITIATKNKEIFFSFVRPEKCGQILRDAGTTLVQRVADFSGGRVEYSDDWYREESEIKPNEVLIGATNRKESKAHTEDLSANDWYIRVVDGKIVINGGSESAVAVAVKYFIATYIEGKDEINIPSKLDKLYISEAKTIDLLSVIDKVKVIGRSMKTESGITCDWTASGIEFTAECEGEVSVGVTVTKAASSYSGDCYFTVFVDGERSPQRLEAKVGDNELTLASGLPKGVHTFRPMYCREPYPTDASCRLCSFCFFDESATTLTAMRPSPPKRQPSSDIKRQAYFAKRLAASSMAMFTIASAANHMPSAEVSMLT